MTVSIADLEATRDGALAWLTDSGVRLPDGAYRTIYRPRTREYAGFYPTETCLLSTAGAVMALERAGRSDLALQSVEHVRELVIEGDPELAGALRAGRGSDRVLANWNLSVALILLRFCEKQKVEGLADVAVRAGRFVLDEMQNPDGSIHQEFRSDRRGNRLRRLLLPRQTWQANCVEAFGKLFEVTGERRFADAAERFVAWLARRQRADGAFPMYQHTLLSGLAAGLRQRRPAEILGRCPVAHPTSHTHAITALLLHGRGHDARRAARWLAKRLGPNGLLYQFYRFPEGHSVEEDVMPTAHFGLLALEHPELELDPELPRGIAEGLAYAQLHSDDRAAEGGLRGLPLHPEVGGDAYCWDTVFGYLFLDRYLEQRGASRAGR